MGRELIYAAGGILWKRIAGEYKIALVYRERYGGKWSLPKGKLEDDESWQEAALREVEEETGSKAKILKYADTINYEANGTPKVVIFWHMKVTGKSSKSPDAETIDLDWFSPKEALDKVEYKEEKEILTGIQYPGSRFKEAVASFFKALNPKKWLRTLGKSTQIERLEGDLKTFKEELNYFIKKDGENNEFSGWGSRARNLLTGTEEEIEKGNIDTAWKNFHGAKRMRIFGLSSSELLEHANILRIEASKLKEWRRKAVYRLIGDPEHPKENITPEVLYLASLIKDEHYNNGYYKNQLVRDVYKVLLIALVVIVGLALVYFNHPDFATLLNLKSLENLQPTNLTWLVFGIILFGTLGGCISAIFHIRDSSGISRIPEIVNNNYITSIRIFIGAGLAFVIFVFLQSDFVDKIFQIDIRPDNLFTYFAIAFVAGFSERLVLKAITTVVGEE